MVSASVRILRLILLAALAVGCTHDREAPAVEIMHVYAQGGDATSPFVVWIHGRGGRPDRFADFWRDFPARVEVALPRGFTPTGTGWAWFEWAAGMSDDALACVVAAAEEKLWPAIREAAHGRQIIVGGFSQGAVLVYVMAARHPDEIRAAFPVSGSAPRKLLPHDHARAAPVFAMHGTDDRVIGVGDARATVLAFTADGATAELREFPGVGHSFTDAMREELVMRIRAAIEKP